MAWPDQTSPIGECYSLVMSHEYKPEPAVTLTLPGGVAIRLPARLDSLTTYVVLEQDDWFEDEIRFVRALATPGLRAVDIGANYGVYALALAASGAGVIACEPAADTAALLRASAAANGFQNLTTVEAAVADAVGTACLSGDSPESRALVAGMGGASGRQVATTTLDALAARHPGPVDFLKIDAEGAETAILAGGESFLAAQDPLVMIEVNAAEGAQGTTAAEGLRQRGYAPYRLIPELLALAPADPQALDRAQLNLFYAKPSRAAALERAGRLASPAVAGDPPSGAGLAWLTARRSFTPFARLAEPRGLPREDLHRRALDHWAVSQDGARPLAERSTHLHAADRAAAGALDALPGVARLCTRARIAAALGLRQAASEALARLQPLIMGESIAIDEPFLAPSAAFDAMAAAIPPLWLNAAAADAYIRLSHYSTFFQGDGMLQPLEFLRRSGHQTPEMERRRQLMRLRAGLQTAVEASPLLAGGLNAARWRAGSDLLKP